jgi:predicted transposase YbfD/YdcC
VIIDKTNLKMQPSDKTFYESLCSDLPDTRRKSGKIHYLPFVLIGFILALLCGRKNRSSAQRFMANNHVFLCKATCFSAYRAISNAQLGRVLRTLDIVAFNKIVYAHYGVEIAELSPGEWVAFDGKDLRGSIDSQLSSRSEVLVHGIRHSDSGIVVQSFYEGDKESEKMVIRDLLKSSKLETKSVTLDALHSDPTTLEQIAGRGGQYIVQVKENQKELTKDLTSKARRLEVLDTIIEHDKGHGRVEKRTYQFYDIQNCLFDKRWEPCHLNALIVVNRHFEVIKSGKIMQEQSLYITNVAIIKEIKSVTSNLANGIRGHWTIENIHQIRDVTFKEDNIKTTRGIYSKTYAIMISLAVACLNKVKPNNFTALIEEFTDDKNKLLKFLHQIRLLKLFVT